jgi:cobalamin synthase
MFIALIIGVAVSMGIGKMLSQFADPDVRRDTGDVLGATNEIARPLVAAADVLIFL